MEEERKEFEVHETTIVCTRITGDTRKDPSSSEQILLVIQQQQQQQQQEKEKEGKEVPSTPDDEEHQHCPELTYRTLYGTCEFDFLKHRVYSLGKESKKTTQAKTKIVSSHSHRLSNSDSNQQCQYQCQQEYVVKRPYQHIRNESYITTASDISQEHKQITPRSTKSSSDQYHSYDYDYNEYNTTSLLHDCPSNHLMRQVEMQSLLMKDNDEKQELLTDDHNLTWPRNNKTHNLTSISSTNSNDAPTQKANGSSTFSSAASSGSKFISCSNRTMSFADSMHTSPLASLFQPYKPYESNGLHQRIRSKSEDLTHFNDIDVQNHIDTFLSTLDKFEDEFDQQAYEELIPLNIRMALENQIFGWNHLYSATLGHVLMPLASYALTYWIISILGLKGIGTECNPAYTWNCTIHKVYEYASHKEEYKPILKLSMASFGFIRVALALWSAFSSFRTIRRRRKVWLHHQATEYFRNNSTAHLDMEQVDRETLLGKLRNRASRRKKRILNRRIMRKIEKAQGRFERRDRKRREFHDGSVEYEGDHHRRVQLLSQRGGAVTRKKTDDENLDVFVDHDNAHDAADEDYSGSGMAPLESSDTDAFFVNYQLYKRTGKEEHERDHAEDTSQAHFYGHTMPAFAMQSIAQDQMGFQNGLIQNVAYAHGGFFGAAPFMLANPHWINILRQLMPDVYVEISRRVVHTPVPQLIHWAENNPVVAAYGTAHELEYFGKVPTLEWDVFLDPHLVQRVEVVLEARDSFLQGLAIQSKRIQTALSHKRAERRYTDKMENIAALLDSEDEKKILHFYNTEIDKRVLLLLEHILIAHGNLSQLALEQTGYLKRYNFSRVKHTRRTLGGGIYLKHWILTYAEALKMSTQLDEDLLGDEDNSVHSNETPTVSAPSSLVASPIREAEATPCMSPKHERRDDLILTGRDYTSPTLKRRHRLNSDSPTNEESSQSKPASGNTSPSKQGGMQESTSFEDLTMAATSLSSISESMNTLKRITDCDAPLGLILDLKSRHVPMHVWSLVLDALRSMGARVEGVASFYQEDIRDMSKYCIAPVKEIMFLHSAGDLQKACHDGLIRRGDSVFFNAGSLFWNYPCGRKRSLANLVGNICMLQFDAEEYKKNYKFQPYARVYNPRTTSNEAKPNNKYEGSETEYNSETNALMPSQSDESDDDNHIKYFEGRSSTIQQYKDHFNISIGLYVQEFAIDEKSMDLLVKFVNKYSNVYDLGFSWGGVNGVTVRGIQPGRFTSTDGLWNQRYVGERWDENLYPHRLH